MTQPTAPCPQCSEPVVVRGGPGQLLRCPTCRKVFPAPRVPPGAQAPEAEPRTPAAPPTARRAAVPPPPTAPAAPAVPARAASPARAAPHAYTPPSYNFKSGRPGVTVAALVCGILFFIPITALLAVILGIVGIVKTSGTRGRGRGFAITGLCLGLLGLAAFATVAPMAWRRGQEATNRARCGANLRQIGAAMMMYANVNRGAYPDAPEALVATQNIASDCFVCPATAHTPAPSTSSNPGQRTPPALVPGKHLSYVYLGKGLSNRAGANTVLAYEPLTNHRDAGINVLFGDGRVGFVAAPMAQRLIAALESGQNPPRSVP
jgi:hypothetical protein